MIVMIENRTYEQITSLTIDYDLDNYDSNISKILLSGVVEANRLAEFGYPIEERSMRLIVEKMRHARDMIESETEKLLNIVIYWDCEQKEYVWLKGDGEYPCYAIDVRRGQLLKRKIPTEVIKQIIENHKRIGG